MAAAMSTKIFTNLFCKNFKYRKTDVVGKRYRSVERNLLFTRFGDSGRSKTKSGEAQKDHLIFEAIGVTEELNASIGLAREFVRDEEKLIPLGEKLLKIQLVLVDIIEIVGSLHPTDSAVDRTVPPVPASVAKVTQKDVEDLETLIMHYGTLLPPVEKIIIPGGGKASAALHVAKAVCRRCERVLVASFKDINEEKDLLAFINRLSTYLFQAARISAKFANRVEHVYKPRLKESETTKSDK